MQDGVDKGVLHQKVDKNICMFVVVFLSVCMYLNLFVFVQTTERPDAWRGMGAEGQMVCLMVAEIKEGIRRLQGVHSDGNYSK